MPVKKIVTYRAWCQFCSEYVGDAHDREIDAFSDLGIHRELHDNQGNFDLGGLKETNQGR